MIQKAEMGKLCTKFYIQGMILHQISTGDTWYYTRSYAVDTCLSVAKDLIPSIT